MTQVSILMPSLSLELPLLIPFISLDLTIQYVISLYLFLDSLLTIILNTLKAYEKDRVFLFGPQ